MRTQRFHNIVDFDNCNEKIHQLEAIEDFAKELVAAAGMHILAGPLSSPGVPENPGFSVVIVVDFSHISIHTFTASNEALIDIFSCKPYNRQLVLSMCKDFFSTPKTTPREKEVWWGG